MIVLPAEVTLFDFRCAILRGEAAKLETLVRSVILFNKKECSMLNYQCSIFNEKKISGIYY